MRSRVILLAAALLAGSVSVAGAQQATGQQPAAGQQSAEQAQAVNPWQLNLSNWIDFGGRGTDISGDSSKFERFRDVRSGPFIDRLRFQDDQGSRILAFGVDNVGYRDQRIFGDVNVPGKLHLQAEWNQIPLWYEQPFGTNGVGGSRSPYAGAGSPVQTLPNDLVSQVQAASGAAQQQLIKSLYGPVASPFDTRARRDTFRFGLLYSATENVNLNFNVSTARREGSQPWAVTFGFGQAAEVAAPVDTRTTDLNAGAEWTNDRGMLRVSYDGSWFTNHEESLTIDSPLRVTDSATAAGHARYALWPSNNSNTVTGAGAISLPAHSRLTANVAVGNWLQDTPLLPMTINSAIANSPTQGPQIALPRSSAEGDIRRVAANVVFSTRPTNILGLTARYRLYDFNDRTPEFAPTALVEYDQQFELTTEELVPAHFSNRYNTFEAEATISALRAVTFGGGYRYNGVSYTEREVTKTNDNAVFLNVDSTSLGMVSVHGVYEHARRRATDFNALALEELPDSGEYAGLRRYDIADLDRDRVTAMVQVMPVSTFAISGSVTATRDNFPNLQFSSTDAFGLQNVKEQGYSISFDATPRDAVTLGAGYGYQKYSSLQRSRRVDVAPTTPPSGQQLDPNRDWSLTEDEKVHYVSASVELGQIIPKTAFRFAWDYNRAESPYVYQVGTTLAAANQLPTVFNRWHTATFDVRYFLRRNIAAGFTYWFERYTVDDFALGPQVTDNVAVPGIVLLGYGFRPARANSFWGRVLVIF